MTHNRCRTVFFCGGGFFVFRVKQTKSPKNPVQEKTIRIVFPKEICYT